MEEKKSVLLHICCGICALESINRLKQQGFKVFGFFYNPNIHPKEEYKKREDVVKEVAKFSEVEIIYSEYNPKEWFSVCENYSKEPEGGKRCSLCYEIRLSKTFEILEKYKFDYFTTTLTISPHKDSEKIFSIGEKIGKEKFLKINFKKQDGFKKTIELSKNLNFYRQNYCGCVYSMNK